VALRRCRAAVDKPRPVPLPTPLVVKNGSKMRCTDFPGGMPWPVSVTVSTTSLARPPVSLPVAARFRHLPSNTPPDAIASRALIQRFRRTRCRGWIGSAGAGHSSAATFALSSIFTRKGSPHHLDHLLDHRRQVHDRATRGEIAAKGEQLLHNARPRHPGLELLDRAPGPLGRTIYPAAHRPPSASA